jgi:hypothetical protein
MFWDKLKGGFVAAKEAGILDAGKDLAADALKDKAKSTKKTTDSAPTSTLPATEKKMSNTVKILIGGGALLIITLIIIKVSQPKKA